MTASVRAVVVPAGVGGAPSETLAALELQTRKPDEVAMAPHVAGFQGAIRGALDRGIDWVWLLDGTVVPEPRALEALLEAIGRVDLLPNPVLLTSKVIAADGSPDSRSLPVPHIADPDLDFSAFDSRVLAVRVVRRGSLLVHRRGIERCGLPNLGFVFFGDDLVWTARLLRPEPGLLVPSSVVVRRPPSERADARRRRASVLSGARLLLSDGLELAEKPWFGGRLVEELLTLVRR